MYIYSFGSSVEVRGLTVLKHVVDSGLSCPGSNLGQGWCVVRHFHSHSETAYKFYVGG